MPATDHWVSSLNQYQQQLATRVKNLPVLPAVLVELNRLFASGDASVAAVASLIKKDAALAIRLLRVVNSPFFGQQNPVTDITQAAVLLGVDEIANMARCLSMIDTTSSMKAWQVLDASSYWRSSLASSAIAKVIAQELNFKVSPDFTACLHNIGICVLADSFPEAYAEVLGANYQLEQAELETFGFNNQYAKAAILSHWQIDIDAVSVVGNKVIDSKVTNDDAKTLAAIVAVANRLADIMACAPCSRFVRLQNPYQDLAAVGIALQDNDAFIAELGAAARAGAYNASKSADPTQVELHELADAVSDNAVMARFYLSVHDAELTQVLQFFIRCWGFDIIDNAEQAEFIISTNNCAMEKGLESHRVINIDNAVIACDDSADSHNAINWAVNWTTINSILVAHLRKHYQFPSAIQSNTQPHAG